MSVIRVSQRRHALSKQNTEKAAPVEATTKKTIRPEMPIPVCHSLHPARSQKKTKRCSRSLVQKKSLLHVHCNQDQVVDERKTFFSHTIDGVSQGKPSVHCCSCHHQKNFNPSNWSTSSPAIPPFFSGTKIQPTLPTQTFGGILARMLEALLSSPTHLPVTWSRDLCMQPAARQGPCRSNFHPMQNLQTSAALTNG